MQEEHYDYLLQIVLKSDTENRVSLTELVNQDIRKLAKGLGFHLLLPDEDEENSEIVYNKFGNNLVFYY
jgi:hypothetical protein